MNLFEFAIARKLGQLIAAGQDRELTEDQAQLADVLERCVNVYQARQQEPQLAKAAQS